MVAELVVPLPPIPDTPYVIGIESGSPIHAVTHEIATLAVWHGDNDHHRVETSSVCGTTVVLARRWGAFARGEAHVDRQQVCPHCAWIVALDPATTSADDDGALFELTPIGVELGLLTPTGPELDALARVMLDPLIAPRACRAILAARDTDRGHDADDARWPRLLGTVTAHRPVVLMGEDCAEDACGHDDRADCYGAEPTVVCLACSILTGPEQGEWQGMVDVAVPAPCSVLTTVAAGPPSSPNWRSGRG